MPKLLFQLPIRNLAIGFCLSFLLTSCCVTFSFNDGSIPDDVETVSIQYFPNYAPLAQPTLSQDFTEALRNLFLQQTSLTLVDSDGDLQFEGEITGYAVTPVAITGNETAALSRLTITVAVRYTNTKNEDENYETTFKRFADFNSSDNLADVEADLIEDINGQLVQDIFTKSFSNW